MKKNLLLFVMCLFLMGMMLSGSFSEEGVYAKMEEDVFMKNEPFISTNFKTKAENLSVVEDIYKNAELKRLSVEIKADGEIFCFSSFSIPGSSKKYTLWGQAVKNSESVNKEYIFVKDSRGKLVTDLSVALQVYITYRLYDYARFLYAIDVEKIDEMMELSEKMKDATLWAQTFVGARSLTARGAVLYAGLPDEKLDSGLDLITEVSETVIKSVLATILTNSLNEPLQKVSQILKTKTPYELTVEDLYNTGLFVSNYDALVENFLNNYKELMFDPDEKKWFDHIADALFEAASFSVDMISGLLKTDWDLKKTKKLFIDTKNLVKTKILADDLVSLRDAAFVDRKVDQTVLALLTVTFDTLDLLELNLPDFIQHNRNKVIDKYLKKMLEELGENNAIDNVKRLVKVFDFFIENNLYAMFTGEFQNMYKPRFGPALSVIATVNWASLEQSGKGALDHYGYQVIGQSRVKEFSDPIFYKVDGKIASDTEFVRLTVQFKDKDGVKLAERHKDFPVMHMNGDKVIMLYLPSHFKPEDYLSIAVDVEEIVLLLNKGSSELKTQYTLDELSFEELRSLKVSGNKDMILFVHGWQAFSKDKFLYDDYKPIGDSVKATGRLEGTWLSFLQYMEDHDLNAQYDSYAYLYDGVFKTPREYANTLARKMEDKGLFEKYDNIFIVAHSMGGIVSRFLMNEERIKTGENYGEEITRLITVNTPHLGSPMGNLFDILEKVYSEDDLMFYDKATSGEEKWADFLDTVITVVNPVDVFKNSADILWNFIIGPNPVDMLNGRLLTFVEEVPVQLIDQAPTFLPVLTSDIYLLGLGGLTTPYPAYKTLRMTDIDYLEPLSRNLFEKENAGVFKYSYDTFTLNNREQYANKILTVNSYVGYEDYLTFILEMLKDLNATTEKSTQDFMTRVAHFAILNQLLERGEKDTKSDGVVPLFSQKGEGLDFEVRPSMSYQNLAHNQILNDSTAIKDIFDYIEEINERETNDGLSEAEANVYKSLIERKYDEAIVILSELLEKREDNAYYYNLRGFVYSEIGEVQKAISDYVKALNIKPDSSEIWNNLGTICSESEVYDEALTYYNNAIELNNTIALYYYNRANTRSRLQEIDGSALYYNDILSDLMKAIQLNEDYIKAYGEIAYVYSELGAADKGLEFYTTGIKRAQSKLEFYRECLINSELLNDLTVDDLNISLMLVNELKKQGRELREIITDEVYMELVNELIEELEDYLLQLYRNRGILYLNNADYERAESDFIKLLSEEPDNLSVHRMLCVLYIEWEKYDKAIQRFERCVAEGIHDYDLYLKIGDVYARLGMIVKALDAYTKASYLLPESTDPIVRRMYLYYNNGDYEAAIHDAGILLKTLPDHKDVYSLVVESYRHLNRYEEAVKAQEQIVRINNLSGESNAEIYYGIADSYYRLNNCEKTLEYLIKEEGSGFSDPILYKNIAVLYNQVGNDEGYIEYMEKYLQTGEGTASDKQNLAITYHNLGYSYGVDEQYSIAINFLNKALNLTPNNAESIYLKGAFLYKSGKTEEGIKSLKKASDLGSENACKTLEQLGIK